jgi:two-component system NtrC family sensor kinase
VVHLEEKEHVQIEVSDSGCGIAKENLSKIFEPFFSTKNHKGIGLGLSVVWGIIDKHQGTITVDSKLNEGSTFIIRLPVGGGASLIEKEKKN